MGAAINFGKSDSIVINSPTHRNTHNAEIFSGSTANNKPRNEILEDIFSSASAEDDFNPRAEESQEFGDFESAFGQTASKGSKIPAASGVDGIPADTTFADFGQAFGFAPSVPVATPIPAQTDNSFLFDSAPVSTATSASLDLFGNNIINNNNTSTQKIPASDLLSDFADLSLGGASGELKFPSKISLNQF